MDPKIIYAKTPTGDEAVRQSTRVVQRNLRMVLVQVDGKLSAGELAEKIGNSRLVEGALRELEEGGFIAPSLEAASIWQDSKLQIRKDQVSALSQFSTFGPKTLTPPDATVGNRAGQNYSSFGKPVLPSSSTRAVESSLPESHPQVEMAYRGGERSISLLTWGMIGLGGSLVLLLALVLFYPYNNLKPAIENAASRLLQTPVKISRINLALLPLPNLTLEDVRIGEAADSRIEAIRIASPYSLLGGVPHRIASIDVIGAVISANQLVALPMLASMPVPASRDIVIRRLRFEQSQVTARDLALRDIAGEILFKVDGSVEKASFQAVERSIRLDAKPSPQGLVLNIEGLAWKPAGFPVSFDSLQAKGLLQKDKLLIQNLDTTFLGGILKGTWLLDWSAGLVMAGEATLNRLDCRKVSAAFVPALKLEGELGGTLRLRASGTDAESLWKNVEATLDADITRGILHGVDLGSAARRGAGSVIRAGSTKFDRLRTTISINAQTVSGRDLKLDAGVMTASGQFSSNRERQIDGNLQVDVQSSVSSLRVPVRISGTLPDLTAFGSN